MLQINHNIKLIRELSGKKQAEFAELIKTNVSNLKTYENTDVTPKANVLAIIAKFAGISLEDLKSKHLTPEDIHFEDEEVDNVEERPYKTTGTVQDRYISLLEETVKETKDQRKELQARLDELTGRQADFLARVEGLIERYEHLVLAQLQSKGQQESGSTPTVLQRTYKTPGNRQKGNIQNKDQQRP
jgi:transcriptional regulator with XRE-family HTH domain